MAANMSRRFSTMELPTPTYQKDMTNDVRLKLAKVRARSRSFCAPSTSSATSPELKTKKSSQLPRSSVTALTTSAKAKQRQPRSNGRNPSTTTTEPSTPVNNFTKCRQSMSNAKSTQHDITTSSSSKTARQPQRNKSSKSTTSKKAHDSIPRNTNNEDMMIKFFESDSDEDDLFFRHKSKQTAEMDQEQQQQRRQRRTTMPPRLIVSDRGVSTSYSPEQPAPVDNADKNHDQSMWAELQELKSRLAKLEVQTPTENGNHNKKSSICSPPITRPSSITSVVSSPHSPLVDSACSIFNNKESKSHSQKLLQDTVLHLENHLRQNDDPNNTDKNTAFMDTLVDLVAETITINQTLTLFGSQQQQQQQQQRHTPGNFISNIASLQKSSERQINLLADALQSLVVYRQQQQQQHGPPQQHPVSPPLSQSIIEPESVSPKPTKPHLTNSSTIYSPPSVRQSRPPAQQCTYSYYHDNPIQNYSDDSSSQHSNLLTTSFNTSSRQQQRQQNRKSVISSSSSSASAVAAPSNLPYYIRYADLDTSPTTKQLYQHQLHEQQSLSSKPVSGILHQQHHPSYQQQQPQQQQQHYYPSSTVEHQRQYSSAYQPIASARVHRLLSMYDSMLKPATTTSAGGGGAPNTNTSPPMSPPSIQQNEFSPLQHHQDQSSYIDYRHH